MDLQVDADAVRALGRGTRHLADVVAPETLGRLLGPVGTYTASMFDLEAPQDPGWWEWGEKVEVSPVAGELYDCADPR